MLTHAFLTTLALTTASAAPSAIDTASTQVRAGGQALPGPARALVTDKVSQIDIAPASGKPVTAAAPGGAERGGKLRTTAGNNDPAHEPVDCRVLEAEHCTIPQATAPASSH